MSPSGPYTDDRRSSRFKVPQARRSCELKVGDNLLSALLVNESKDGFAVLVDRVDSLKARKTVELHTVRGSFLVWIVYIKDIVRPKDTATECGPWFQVGLQIKQRLRQRRLPQ
jgi:hypothetical protein